MKRSILCGILGLVLTAAATAHANTGGIYFTSYREPYNPVMWQFGYPVQSTDGVTLTLWFGEGNLSADQLSSSAPLSWNVGSEFYGYPGFYNSSILALQNWSPGETWTFQVRATGNSIYGPVIPSLSVSQLWHESQNILDVGGNPPGIPGVSTESIGFTVYITPEPSTFSLAGIGGTALILFRRRRH